MNILIAASEIFPLAKTGSLGDTIYHLSKYISRSDNHKATVAIPYYKKLVENKNIEKTDITFNVDLGSKGKKLCTVYKCSLQKCKSTPIFLLYNEEYFNRDKMYSDKTYSYSDNDERWIFFSKAVIKLVEVMNLKFDIIHSHDWQTALIPALIKILHSDNKIFENTKQVFTIHNLAFQGLFPPTVLDKIGINWDYFNSGAFEFWGHVNFIKGGLVFADKITTMSETYLSLIKTSEYGYGLDGLINYRADDCIAINYGIDEEIWDPKKDDILNAKYDIQNIDDKLINKHSLQRELNLEITSEKPLFGIISRLTEQKGIDLIIDLLKNLNDLDIQIVLLGKGEEYYEKNLYKFLKDNHRNLSINILFSEELAHQIEGSCDFLIIPSQFEAATTNQLYSMKYGTIPIVSSKSGLSNLIKTDSQNENGIIFNNYDYKDLKDAINYALECFDNKEKFSNIVKNSMQIDVSWKKTVNKFIQLYTILTERGL